MRLILAGITVAFIYLAITLDSSAAPLKYWLTIVALSGLSLFVFKKFFTFFLTTTLLAYNYADLNSTQSFYSMVLPIYLWFSIIVLLVTAVLTYPELLGRKTHPSDTGSSADSFDIGCGGDGGCGGD